MNLTQEEILHIELYIESKNLKHIDLKQEVLDHMANGIEDKMKIDKVSFVDAFEIVRKEWNSELQSHTSLWLGLLHPGPKIMIKKSTKLLKQIYARTLLYSGLITFLLYVLNSFYAIVTYEEYFAKTIGIFYLALFGLIIFFSIKMRFSRISSTHRSLFKMNVIGMSFAYIYLNPLLHFNGFIRNGKVLYFNLFLFIFIGVYFYSALKLYREHSKIVKQQVA